MASAVGWLGTMLACSIGTGLLVDFEHFAGDLGVTGLVGADEAELVAADVGGEAVEQEKAADEDEDGKLAGIGEVGVALDGEEPAGKQGWGRGEGLRFCSRRGVGRRGLGGGDHARFAERDKGSRVSRESDATRAELRRRHDGEQG